MATSKLSLSDWDVTDYLRTEEEIALFIEVVQQDSSGDKAFIAKMMEEVERARRLNEARPAPDAENPEWTGQMVKESVRFDDLSVPLQQKLKK